MKYNGQNFDVASWHKTMSNSRYAECPKRIQYSNLKSRLYVSQAQKTHQIAQKMNEKAQKCISDYSSHLENTKMNSKPKGIAYPMILSQSPTTIKLDEQTDR